MAKYLEGIQQTTDVIGDYDVVASGTLTASGSASPPSTPNFSPKKNYRNYAIFFKNKLGQSLTNIQVKSFNSKGLLPNGIAGDYLYLTTITNTTANNGLGIATLAYSHLAILGDIALVFNTASIVAAGNTIDYLVVGY